jgi:hypothetical protein
MNIAFAAIVVILVVVMIMLAQNRNPPPPPAVAPPPIIDISPSDDAEPPPSASDLKQRLDDIISELQSLSDELDEELSEASGEEEEYFSNKYKQLCEYKPTVEPPSVENHPVLTNEGLNSMIASQMQQLDEHQKAVQSVPVNGQAIDIDVLFRFVDFICTVQDFKRRKSFVATVIKHQYRDKKQQRTEMLKLWKRLFKEMNRKAKSIVESAKDALRSLRNPTKSPSPSSL